VNRDGGAPAPGRVDARVLWFAGLAGAGVTALDVASSGDLAVVLVALAVGGLVALIWFVPLRWSVLTLLFLGATLEAPYEAFAEYRFRTPWYLAGTALLGNLNLVTHVAALKFSGFDVLVVYLLLVHAVRRLKRSRIDGGGYTPLPRPLLLGAVVSASTLLLFWAWGLVKGGDFGNSLWQMQKPLYVPVLIVVLHTGLRGSRDLPALAKVLLGAAVYRALLATYIHFTVLNADGSPMAFATTHGDSILFAAAVVLICVIWNERVELRRRWLLIVPALVILEGMVANGRRLVWVSLAGAMAIVALISPWTAWKRRMARALIAGAPLAVLYLAAGWHSDAAVFRPAAMIRSVVESDTDSSSRWRDMENMNLVWNISAHPFFGIGFGHEYVEYRTLDSVAGAYPMYRYIPHNSVLGLFAFTGALGVAGIWSLLVATVFLAARAYHRAHRPADRAGALMCIVFVFLYVNQTYGDIGVGLWISPLTVAPAAVLAGKLAISTGAWAHRRGGAPVPAPPALAPGSADPA
jgi:O-antigen ligase